MNVAHDVSKGGAVQRPRFNHAAPALGSDATVWIELGLSTIRPWAATTNGMDAPTRNGIDVPKWKCHQPLEPRGASIMKVATIGIDLAKSVFQVHGVDARGHVVVRKQLRRDQVGPFFANLPACLVGMEACGGAHFWARP
jgi:hypothetical protein